MAEDGTMSALSEVTPQPAPNPDAQATVNDFLDYTEFFPSDLVRSLRLIGNLDATYEDATLTIHELTKTYGKLPEIPASERPNPAVLRKQISDALERAIYCRESTFTEASRLYEVAERHCRRLSVIKTKLQGLPQPPSRDPTPVPVSPQASRSLHRTYDRYDRKYVTNSVNRQRDRNRKFALSQAHGRSRARTYSSSDDSDGDSDNVATSKVKIPKERPPKPPRVRPAGAGTNVHSGIAGISTSNALARLSPPPPNARPGSKHAPWLKLTEYEMAVLRKQMKKNAVWTPSETMVKRELEKKKRGLEYYEREKARCEAAGEEFLDEEPDKLPSQKLIIPARTEPKVEPNVPVAAGPSTSEPAPTPAPVPASAPVPAATPAPSTATGPVTSPIPAPAVPVVPSTPSAPVETVTTPKEQQDDEPDEDVDMSEGDMARREKREEQREQAMRDAQELEDAGRKIREAAESLKDLIFTPENVNVTPASARRRSATKAFAKRKRETTPPLTAETPTIGTREPSLASQDSGSRHPDAKRQRTLLPAPVKTPVPPPPPSSSTPQPSTPAMLSPVANTPVPLPNDTLKGTTVQVPLAPAGPSTPKVADDVAQESPSPRTVPAPLAGAEDEQLSPLDTPSALPSAPESAPEAANGKEPADEVETDPASASLTASSAAQSLATAASTRPRRESVKEPSKAVSPSPAPLQPIKIQNTQEDAIEPAHSSPIPVPRPRSRGVPTPKAQSEEPKQNDAGKPARELRRHSIFSQSAVAAPTRMSTRKKPPPKGDITSAENGQKTVTNVKRAQGSKNKKKKKTDDDSEPPEEIDPNEPRYCICDDVSYGQMISCDNNCDKEWFHLECVNMTPEDIPSRRSKWYCPECRVQMNVDAYGKELVPPPLPGRRGNR